MFPIRDSIKTEKFPFVTWTIIIINVVVFIYQLLLPDVDAFIAQYALVPAAVDMLDIATWWPFFTSMFMHAGFMHIISNMWFLAVFGDNIENRMGHLGFLGFYLIAGFLAAFAQFVPEMTSLIPVLGASGAIAGVLGAYFIIYPHATVRTLIIGYYGARMADISAQVMLGYWGVIQLISSVGSIVSIDNSGVAWLAHLGGFAFGILVGLLIKYFGGSRGFIDRPYR